MILIFTRIFNYDDGAVAGRDANLMTSSRRTCYLKYFHRGTKISCSVLTLAWRSRESRRPCTRKITFLHSGVKTSASHRLRRGMLSGECHYIRDRRSLWFHPAKKVGPILRPPFVFQDLHWWLRIMQKAKINLYLECWYTWDLLFIELLSK